MISASASEVTERRTGRTTRMVDEAVGASRSGGRVAILAPTWAMVKCIRSMCADRLGREADVIDVMLADGAYERLRGFRGKVFIDHACKRTELIDEAVLLASLDCD